MKTCSKCGEPKPKSEFCKHASTRDRLRPDCKACKGISDAKWRADHQQEARAYQAAYSVANAVKRNAATAKWNADNQERRRINKRNYRARMAGGKLSIGLAGRLFKLQLGKCACGCKQPLGDDYHMDHIMPLALGGTNTDDNIQLLRSICNLQKSAKHPVNFMQERGFLI